MYTSMCFAHGGAHRGVYPWWCTPPCALHMEERIAGSTPGGVHLHVLCTWRSASRGLPLVVYTSMCFAHGGAHHHPWCLSSGQRLHDIRHTHSQHSREISARGIPAYATPERVILPRRVVHHHARTRMVVRSSMCFAHGGVRRVPGNQTKQLVSRVLDEHAPGGNRHVHRDAPYRPCRDRWRLKV